jgi:hypothetical protein
MDIEFLVTTYNRQRSCQALVDSLQGCGDVVVLNDGCDYLIHGCKQYFLSSHNGKRFYWETVKILFSLRGQHQYYIMLPDDFLFSRELAEEAIRMWNGIDDPQKICLNLYADRMGLNCWTSFQPVDMGEYYRTGWVDMCFLCEERFFNIIHISEIHSNRNNRSSGVGAQISCFLFQRDYHFYQVKNSLIILQPEHNSSQMYDPSQIITKHDKHKRRISARTTEKRAFDTRRKK